MTTEFLHQYIGWIAILFGVISGSIIGLFFHQEEWAGGYNSFQRRLIRLGHIAFIGLGLINLAFGITLNSVNIHETCTSISSAGFMVGLLTMPLVCFLTAWKKNFRHLFPLPVFSLITGIISILIGWPFP